MPRYAINAVPIPPISAKPSTALLVIDAQLGFQNRAHFGSPSNPSFERNLALLLAAFRETTDELEAAAPRIFHVQHPSVWTDHPLHPSHTGPYNPDGTPARGVDFLPCAYPVMTNLDGSKRVITSFDEPKTPEQIKAAAERREKGGPQNEMLMTKHGQSVFVNTPLESILRDRGITTLVVCGTALDGAVSTAVRTAQNLALCGKWGGKGNVEDAAVGDLYTDGEKVVGEIVGDDGKRVQELVDMPRIILVEDATRSFIKPDTGIDPDVAHRVHVESLREYADVRTTEEVVAGLAASSSS
ncbi:hypothetical protein HKX48_004744 [Thoreauomyces humboldtii]|nr:hypothetical protein HKX48_004744 [Thoreauomyces humboldtii]